MSQFRTLLFAALVTSGLLLMAEAAATLFGAQALLKWAAPVPLRQTGATYLPGNPYLLWEMAPGTRTELGVDIRVNSLGFRGPEVVLPKPSGQRRIVIVGDSSVYGHGVEEDATFAHRLEQAMGTDVEVINAGVPGYSTFQTLNLLRMRGWATEPDVLVIANLWSDNNFDSFVDATLISERTDHANSWAAPVSTWLRQSALYRVLDWHLRLAPRAARVQKVGWMLGRAPSGPNRRVDVNSYAVNLQQLVDEARNNGASPMFLALANTVDLGAPHEGAIAWTLYRQVMSDTASRNGIPLVDVTTAMKSTSSSSTDLFIDEMHPSPEGHRIIAEALEVALQPWASGAALTAPRIPSDLSTYLDPYTQNGGGPAAAAPVDAPTLSGMVDGPDGVPIQIDLVDLDAPVPPANAPLVGSARFDSPGPFTMAMPTSGRFGVRVYLDPEGDGPGEGDPVHDFFDAPINASGESVSDVRFEISN